MFKIKIKISGDHNKTKVFLERAQKIDFLRILERYGKKGVEALSNSTPKRTGKTASSWNYRVLKTKTGYTIEWYNTNQDSSGTFIAILIQYGHGTGTGGYVEPRDYVNPAITQIFSALSEEITEEISR